MSALRAFSGVPGRACYGRALVGVIRHEVYAGAALRTAPELM